MTLRRRRRATMAKRKKTKKKTMMTTKKTERLRGSRMKNAPVMKEQMVKMRQEEGKKMKKTKTLMLETCQTPTTTKKWNMKMINSKTVKEKKKEEEKKATMKMGKKLESKTKKLMKRRKRRRKEITTQRTMAQDDARCKSRSPKMAMRMDNRRMRRGGGAEARGRTAPLA